MIDYSSFSLRTLKQMCTGQFLTIVPSHGRSISRQDCIDTLNSATTPQNSFMTLPPELREMIYCEMLRFSEPRPHGRLGCSPQILACNRFINNEAADILYKTNLFVIELTDHFLTVNGIHCSVYPLFEAWLSRQGGGHNPCPTASVGWPRFLLRTRNLRIQIGDVSQLQTHWGFDRSFKMDINRIFYSLCSFLATTGFLGRLEVDLRWTNNNIRSTELEALCYPLIMLGKLDSLMICTSDTNVIHFTHEAYNNPSITKFIHSGSVLAPALALADAAKVYKSLADTIKFGTSQHSLTPSHIPYPADWTRLFHAMDAVLYLINDPHGQLFQAGQMHMYDGSWEQNVTSATNNLKQAFVQLNVLGLFKNSGSGYGDLINNIQEWRMIRWASRFKPGKEGAAAALEQTNPYLGEEVATRATPEEIKDLLNMSVEELQGVEGLQTDDNLPQVMDIDETGQMGLRDSGADSIQEAEENGQVETPRRSKRSRIPVRRSVSPAEGLSRMPNFQ